MSSETKLFGTGSITTNGGTLTFTPSQAGSFIIQITGTWGGTLQFEATTKGDPDWFSVNAQPITGVAGVTSTTTNGQWSIANPGFRQLRVRASAFASGTATIDFGTSLGSRGNSAEATGGTGANATQVQGDVAHDSADSGNPVKIGGTATAAVPAAVTEGDRVNASFDLQGRMRTLGTPPTFLQDTSGIAATGAGTVVTLDKAVSTFALRVKELGGTVPISWDVRLEVDLINEFIDNNTELMAHTNIDGDGLTKWKVDKPARFMRYRVDKLTGGGTLRVTLYAI